MRKKSLFCCLQITIHEMLLKMSDLQFPIYSYQKKEEEDEEEEEEEEEEDEEGEGREGERKGEE